MSVYDLVCHPVLDPEECPKWKALKEVLAEIDQDLSTAPPIDDPAAGPRKVSEVQRKFQVQSV